MKSSGVPVMAWRNLWRNRRRTLLTLLSIVFGVFLAVIFTAMQDRNWADMIQLAARMGGGHVTLQHPEYLDKPTLSRAVANTGELRRLALETQHATRSVERIVGFALLSTARDSLGAGFLAVDPENEDDETLSILDAIVEGEFFATSSDPGVILGERLALNLGLEIGSKVVFTMSDRTGEIVGGLARVSGIVRTGSSTMDGGFCLLPLDSVRKLLGFSADEAIQVAVFIDDQRRSAEVAEALREKVGDDVATLPWYELQPQLASFIAMKIGGAIFMEIVIAILVAAGIFNTLFVSVMERLREFGILVALGFSPSRLFRLVMMESLWLAVLGLVGAGLVTIGPYVYLYNTGIDISAALGDEGVDVAGVAMSTVMKIGIYPINAVIIASLAIFSVLLSGLYPAWKAGRANPVETIQLV